MKKQTEAATNADQWCSQIATYQTKLFALLHTAVTELEWELIPTPHCELRVMVSSDNALFLYDQYTFPLALTGPAVAEKLARFEGEVEWQLERINESKKVSALREQALAKLSPEERKSLGF